MRAVVMRSAGGPEVLQVEEVPEPEIAADEVLVEVDVVTVNRTLDLAARSGAHKGVGLPHVPGVDPAGTVLATGSDVTDRQPGDRVAVVADPICGPWSPCGTEGRRDACRAPRQVGIHQWGGYAQRVAVTAIQTHRLPDGLPFADAAVLLRHAPLAFELLRKAGKVRAGQTVLVMGATGGLGGAGVQVAKLLGATVIAGAGADERVAQAVADGADHGVNYRASDLAESVRELTGGRGVDVVYENISDPTLWPGALASLARRGRLVTAGAHGGGVVPLDVRRLYTNRLKIVGTADISRAGIESTLEAAARGELTARFDRPLPLEGATDAHRRIEQGESNRKILLRPAA